MRIRLGRGPQRTYLCKATDIYAAQVQKERPHAEIDSSGEVSPPSAAASSLPNVGHVTAARRVAAIGRPAVGQVTAAPLAAATARPDTGQGFSEPPAAPTLRLERRKFATSREALCFLREYPDAIASLRALAAEHCMNMAILGNDVVLARVGTLIHTEQYYVVDEYDLPSLPVAKPGRSTSKPQPPASPKTRQPAWIAQASSNEPGTFNNAATDAQVAVLRAAAQNGTPFCAVCDAARLAKR